jgi:hypothetical protein
MKIAVVFLALIVTSPVGALTTNEWQFRQTIDVPSAGLMRINLPAETLNAGRPDLTDLRVLDAGGNEISYLIEQPKPRAETAARPKDFRVELGFRQTELHIITGTDAPLNGLILDIPTGPRFNKAVRIEGSRDEINWQMLTSGAPIFRTQNAEARSRISFPEGRWKFLRAILDDSRSEPVPVTGAELILSGAEAPAEKIALRVASRDENARVTRIGLDLGAANFLVASLIIETPEPLFTRHATIAAFTLSGDRLREETIANGVIYRVETNGNTDARLDIPVEKQIRGRELILFIENGDDAPIALSSIDGTRRISRVLFSVPAAGTYTLLSGNTQCGAPRYNFPYPQATPTDLMISSLAENPNYTAHSEPMTGAKIDLADWKFRKPLRIVKSGAQQIELDPDVLAQSSADLRDIRLVSNNQQWPYLIETTSIFRDIPLPVVTVNDRDHPTISRWSIKLPQAGLPVTRLTCASSSPVFERAIRLWEELANERGEKYSRELGRATWRHPASQPNQELVIALETAPRTGTLFLETDNRDNPPIELHDVHGRYPVIRLLFSAPAGQSLWLYYGNSAAAAPHYDLSLIADELLRSERVRLVAGAAEKLKSERVSETLTGSARYIFWTVLAVVVIALLVLLSRLLPKAA